MYIFFRFVVKIDATEGTYFYNYLFLSFFLIYIRVVTCIFYKYHENLFLCFQTAEHGCLRTTAYLAQIVRAWYSQYTRWINGKN